MTFTRIIECIGVGDADVARLRLLMRSAAARLDVRWEWGAQGDAHLVVVDPHTLAGDTARNLALQSGVPCVVVIDDGVEHAGALILRRPFHLDDVVRVLNAADTARASGSLSLVDRDDDFFLVDLGEPDHHVKPAAAFVPHAPVPAPTAELSQRDLDAFEALFKRDELADTPTVLLPDAFDSDAGVADSGPQSRRSMIRNEARSVRIAADDAALGNHIAPALRGVRGADDARCSLLEFLDVQWLAAPSRATLAGVADLVLDPKLQVFHIVGGLAEAELYCLQTLQRADWRPLLGNELDVVRAQSPALPYVQLQWLYHLVNSSGRLAPHLDPGGDYWLAQAFALESDYSSQARIGACMATACRLDEIAAASKTGMEEVFNVVNAYEAVGYLQWRLRDRFRDDGAARSANDPVRQP